jgi:chromosomal replication initiator protein
MKTPLLRFNSASPYRPSSKDIICSMNNLNDLVLLKGIVTGCIERVRKQDFLTYFKKLSIVSLEPERITLGVVSNFVKDNLLHKFQGHILASVQSLLPAVKTITLVVDAQIDNPSNPLVVDCHKEYRECMGQKKKEVVGEEVVEGINSRSISEKYRLDNFIVGPCSQFPFAACEAVVRKPGSAYNPLFIYGGVGLGKTHLLQAVGNAIRERHKDKRVIYTTADRFLNEYIACIKKRTVDKLRDRFRTIDVLIIDDVQFLSGKKQTQEELYNIFNILYENGKQIILSGDRSPKELTELEPRLQSRIGWGVMAYIESPDFETRLAILQDKARQREFLLPQESAEYIAYHTGANVRELEGILNQVIAEYELHGTPATVENIARRLDKLAIRNDTFVPAKQRVSSRTYEELIDAVSAHFGLDKKMIIGEDRKKETMVPRQVAMYLLKNKMNYTYERIGNIFSGRNHSAVMYSCKKLESMLKKNQNLLYEINLIRDKLGL